MSIKGGKDVTAMPTTKSEDAYNNVLRGTGQDIKNMSLGVASVVAGAVSLDTGLVAKGVYDLMQINSLNQDVKNFVGEENLQKISSMASIVPTTDSEQETTSEEKKKKKVSDLEEVVTDGNKQDSLDGINLPPISEDDMNWLIKQPFMKDYKYEGIS